MTIRRSTEPYQSADLIFEHTGTVNAPGELSHGKPVTAKVWREKASLGATSNYDKVTRYTWEIRFPDNPAASYRRKQSGRKAEADIQAFIQDATDLIKLVPDKQ